MPSTLDQLKEYTVVVADTGDFESMRQYKPTDATTNPSLILAAANLPQYQRLIEQAIEYGKRNGNDLSKTMDYVCVLFGCEILKIIPGRVSTEVDARLSFDRDASVEKALGLIALYAAAGVPKDRVLIKLAATWEGIEAARELESKHGVHCNLTLLFSFGQAVACAEASVTLISPFVGRIYDWHVKRTGVKTFADPSDDPGVQSVTRIYQHYKLCGYQTVVMGASFRNISQIKCLAGCDLLTIAPSLLRELAHEADVQLQRRLTVGGDVDESKRIKISESEFRWQLNADEMASDKLSEGIRNFAADAIKLENIIKAKLHA